MKKLSHNEESILVFALRYALPRNTTAPGIVISELSKNWNFITPNTQIQIMKEIDSWMQIEVAQFKKCPGFEVSSYYEWKKFYNEFKK